MSTHPFHNARSENLTRIAATNTDRMVIERLADNSGQCQCLAAWDDSRQCVCGDTRVEVPLSIKAAKRAAHIISQIESLDHRIELTRTLAGDMVHSNFNPKRQAERGGICFSDGHQEITISFKIPKQMLLALMQAERIDLIGQLQETGIVSIDLHNIKVRPE